MRTMLPSRWTERTPDLIQRRTVRTETLRALATSAMVTKRGGLAGCVSFPAAMGHPTPRRRSSDGTLISLRAPTFVHSISPLFILL